MTPAARSSTEHVALVGGLVTLATGLVLMFGFHVGHGCLRTEALGVGRIAWLNAHRLGAVALLGSTLLHAIDRRAPLWARLRRVFAGRTKRHDVREVGLYVLFTVLVVTGFAALLVLPDGQPFYGPPMLGPIPAHRHGWIDVHDFAGLIALTLGYEHVRERWYLHVRRHKPVARRSGVTADVRS
jgi:hypothetical protein